MFSVCLVGFMLVLSAHVEGQPPKPHMGDARLCLFKEAAKTWRVQKEKDSLQSLEVTSKEQGRM